MLCPALTPNERIILCIACAIFFLFMFIMCYRENKKAQELNRKYSLAFQNTEKQKKAELKGKGK